MRIALFARLKGCAIVLATLICGNVVEVRSQIAPAEIPPAEVLVSLHGREAALTPAVARLLRSRLEALFTRCGILQWGLDKWPERIESDLAIEVEYGSPFSLETWGGFHPRLDVSRMLLTASASKNEGWPLQFVEAGGKIGSFSKCDGVLTLELMCSEPLRDAAPESVTYNCRTIRPRTLPP